MSARVRSGMAAELGLLLQDRRLGVLAVLAALCSLAAGFVTAALAARLGGVAPIELQLAVVSRGAASQLAVVLVMTIAVAGRYRDGSWLHAALAQPRPGRRLLVAATPLLPACLALGLLCALAAATGAAIVGRADPTAVLVPVCLHLAALSIWSLWMLGLAHLSRSPLLTLALGAGLLMVEPAVAGLLAQAGLDGWRWLLPGQALRALAELPAVGGALLQPVPPAALPTAIAAIVACTGAIGAAAWLRLRGPQPR